MKFRIFVVVFALFGAINLANALHKGGDFQVFLEAGDRLLAARPLYEGSGPGIGVTWPPALAVLFAPFAMLSNADPRVARVVWHLVSLCALLGGVACWARALFDVPPADRRSLWSSAPVLMSLAAIALPAQTNFEHQNMNALLLLLLGAGAYGCVRGSPVWGGAWIGAAAAIKAFPALLIAYLALRRQWRACAGAVAASAALTAAPAFWYGPAGAWETLRQWLDLAGNSDWPVRVQNQSVFAMASRLAPEIATGLSLAIVAALLSLLAWLAWECRRLDRSRLGPELALALACAVLISPIAWDHYWVLMFPAFLAAALRPERHVRAAFWTAAILVSGLSPLTLGARGFGWVRSWSASTLAGLLLVVVQKKARTRRAF